jgi:hypothetical protein|nr:MAG TPA: hypothetical protein [Caudoviricetes sp.]
MENLPEKVNTQSVALAIYNPTPGTKAIDIRRQMVQLPEVAKSLSGVEKYIFAASTKTQIAEIDDATLVAKTGQMFRFIALDVGYIIPTNTDDWAYICTRLLDILKKYYSQMTLADIKLAFELATTGELDDYLPKDRNGQPDKAHYQQFNADYFAKILNAYRRKQNGVIHKAYQALPEPKKELTPEQKRYYHNDIESRNRLAFLQYKYTGRVDFGIAGEMFVYDWLVKVGLADTVKETEDDRREALGRFLARAARGFVNEFTVYHVRKDGTKSKEIDYTAFEVARRKEIIKAFDRMIADGLQVDNYLNFWK